MLIRSLFCRPRRWLILFVVCAALATPSGAAARPDRQMPDFSGCRSVQGDAWFVDELSFDALAIAPGVLVEPLEKGVRLSNSTDTPLYLVEVFGDDTFYAPAAPISLTPPLGVRQRVLAGEVASWYSVDGSSAPQWNTALGIDSLAYEGSIRDMWLPRFTQDLHYADDRPAGVAVPPAKTYALSVIYGDTLFEIPVTQTYRLNPAYDPNQERTQQAACDERGDSLIRFVMLVIACGAIVIIGGVALVVYGLMWLLRPAA